MASVETPTTIYISESDKAELNNLLSDVEKFHPQDRDYAETLVDELERAEVVAAADIPRDVITMNSKVRVRDLDTGNEFVCMVVFPWDADYSRNRISVLAPIGTALLGYKVGDVIKWKVPSRIRRMKVESIFYQPESAGDKADSIPTNNEDALSRTGV